MEGDVDVALTKCIGYMRAFVHGSSGMKLVTLFLLRQLKRFIAKEQDTNQVSHVGTEIALCRNCKCGCRSWHGLQQNVDSANRRGSAFGTLHVWYPCGAGDSEGNDLLDGISGDCRSSEP